ncbi:fusion protein containing ompA-signal peptide/RNase T1 [Hypoxylon sp. FL1284]|nr:fusion protein containing ompA-signal peptide/RNase T1 [Hypoxylon sp. FL1284]
MFSFKVLPAVLLAAVSVSALAVEKITTRDDCVATCGSVCYWQSDIDDAVKKGYSLHQSGDTLGSGDYPHQYNNYEGFDFPDPSPWYEFPILSSFDVYDGGSPGADRVVFDNNGKFEAAITHTGASGNDFVACT